MVVNQLNNRAPRVSSHSVQDELPWISRRLNQVSFCSIFVEKFVQFEYFFFKIWSKEKKINMYRLQETMLFTFCVYLVAVNAVPLGILPDVPHAAPSPGNSSFFLFFFFFFAIFFFSFRSLRPSFWDVHFFGRGYVGMGGWFAGFFFILFKLILL